MNKLILSKKVIMLVLILTCITLVVTLISTYMVYKTSSEAVKSSLVDIVQGEKILIETLHKNGLSEDSILTIIRTHETSRKSIGETGEFVIAKLVNDSICYLRRKDIKGNVPNISLPANIKRSVPTKMAVKGFSGSIEDRDYNGVQVFAGYTYYKPFNWGIVAKIDADEFNRPFYWSLFIALLLALILIFFGAILFIRITNPMLKAIIKSEEKLSITLNSIGDAVIATDERGIITGLNPVAERLCGWEENTAKGKELKDVFKIINTSTREVVEDPVAIVLEKGEVIGLANHTSLISKDGTEYFIADSAAPIKDKTGKIVGVVLVFSDISEKYKAEEMLIESEKKYRQLYNKTPVMLHSIDNEGKLMSVSDYWLENLGYEREEVIGHSFSEFLTKESRQYAVETVLPDFIKNGYCTNIEYQFVKKNGEIIDTLLSAVSEYDEFGKFIRSLAVIIDITESKRAEVMLKESEEFTRRIIDSSNDCIKVLDIEGNLLSMSLGGQKLLEIDDITQYINKSWIDFWKDKDYEDAVDAIAQAKNGNAGIFSGFCATAKGTPKWWEVIVSPIKDAQGNVFRLLALSRDITERKKAEDMLRESEEKYRKVVENISEALLIEDINGKLIYANNEFFNMFGYTKDEMSNLSLKDYTAPDWQDEIIFRHNQRMKGVPVSEQFEYEGIRKDGTKIWIEAKVAILKENGKIIGTQSFERDITEKKKAEIHLQHITTVLKAIRNVNQLITHERNPEILIREACKKLIEGRGYSYARIITLDNNKIIDYADASVFDDSNFKAEFKNINDLPVCMLQALDHEGVLVTDKNHADCKKCPAGLAEVDYFSISLRLEFDNKIYGVLSVTIPFSFVFDKEEESLFLELAGDISFALAAIEQEEQKMKAEELLRESEEFKRRIIDSSNDCIKVVDFEGNLLSMSIGGQKLLEIDDITVYINKSWIDFWKGQDYEDAVEAISQAKNGNVGIFTGYCATEKGTPKWWEIIVSPIKDAQGNVFRLLALSRDITERKHTEEALLATEIRYRSLFESSKDGILILDAETGIIVDVNPFLIELLGYSKDQFIDKAIWEIGFFKDIVANQDNFLELQNKEYIRYEDLPLETAEGRKINVEFVSNVYLVNNQKVIQCNIRDISERKLAEVEKMKAMKEIESLSRFPAENPNPVMRLSNECELLYANYAAQEIVDFCGITLGHTAPTFMCDLISEVLAHGSVKTIENQFGDKIWSMTIAPITNAGYVNIYCNDITERKKAELELRRSEEDLKASQRIAHIGSWRLDLATNEVFWTEELYNMYGFDPSVPPPPYTEHMKLFTPESWEKLSTALDNTAKTGIPYELELKTLRKDGSNGWMWVFGKTILDENGIKVGLMGAAQDITDRKKAEEALVHSHDLMRYVIENNNGAIAIHDKDLKYIYVSQRYLYDFKVKEKNIIGKHHYDVFPDLPQKWRDVHQKALCGVISSADNDPYPREDGSLEWTRWECRPWYEADGSIGGIIIYTEVITDRKLAEFALKESEERYSTIVNSSPNVILIHVNGIIKYVNNFGEKLFDYTQEEMIGKTPLDFLDDESIPLVTTNLQRRAEGEFVPSYEAKIITKSGEIRHVLIQATFIQYQSEKAFLVVLTDISELKKYEFEMEIAMKKAKESDNLKTAFLQNMSHEIRTPLNGILGFSKLLNSENLSREDIIDYTSAISLSGKRLLEVVNDILDISRIQTGQVIIENNQFSINSIFTDLQQFFSPNANLKNISLNCHLSEDDNTTIISDETKLYQILSNLINNSLKFTETGSIDYGYEFKENIIHFFVKDSGIGISSEFFDKIFERFTQGDMSISRGYEGAGLGLSICKGLVELLGGEIWIESEINKGTTVFFNLPLENSEIISQPEDIKLEEPKKLDARTVLIAEDDDVSFQYLQKLLEKLGLNVIRAKNGEQAVDMVKRIPDIVLIFMDIKMPVMGGLEATNLVKKINPDIPVIAQTAYAFTEERLNILSNGCDDYIAKPLDNRKVINIIEKYLK